MKTKTDSRPDRWRTRRASGPGVVGGRPGGGAGSEGEGKQGVPSIEGAREEGAIAGHRGRRRRELGRKGRGSSALRRAPARFHGHRVAIRPLFRVTREGGSTCPVPPLPSRPPPPPPFQSLRLVLPLLVLRRSRRPGTPRGNSPQTPSVPRARSLPLSLPLPLSLSLSLSLCRFLEAISPRSRLGLSSRVSPGFCTVVSAPSDAGEPRVVARVAPELSRNSLAPRSISQTKPRPLRVASSVPADVSFTFIAFLHYGGS